MVSLLVCQREAYACTVRRAQGSSLTVHVFYFLFHLCNNVIALINFLLMFQMHALQETVIQKETKLAQQVIT